MPVICPAWTAADRIGAQCSGMMIAGWTVVWLAALSVGMIAGRLCTWALFIIRLAVAPAGEAHRRRRQDTIQPSGTVDLLKQKLMRWASHPTPTEEAVGRQHLAFWQPPTSGSLAGPAFLTRPLSRLELGLECVECYPECPSRSFATWPGGRCCDSCRRRHNDEQRFKEEPCGPSPTQVMRELHFGRPTLPMRNQQSVSGGTPLQQIFGRLRSRAAI